MKVSFKQLSDSFPSLQQLAQVQFPAKVSYRLGRIMASAQSELEHFRKAQLDLIKKHGGVEDEQGVCKVPDAKLTEYVPEFEDLLAETADIWGDPLNIDLLGDAEIAPATLIPLDWLIVSGDEPEKAAKAANG